MRYAPDRLISTVAEMLSAQNEKHLSRLLKISVSLIQGIRSGAVQLTPTLLQHLADCVGSTVDALRIILGDRRQKARMAFSLPRPARA